METTWAKENFRLQNYKKLYFTGKDKLSIRKKIKDVMDQLQKGKKG